MNTEEIIRMAHEAGLHIATDVNWMPIIGLEHLERFFHMAQAAEREACAQLAEGWRYLPENNFSKAQIVENMCKTIAHHIRERNNQ